MNNSEKFRLWFVVLLKVWTFQKDSGINSQRYFVMITNMNNSEIFKLWFVSLLKDWTFQKYSVTFQKNWILLRYSVAFQKDWILLRHFRHIQSTSDIFRTSSEMTYLVSERFRPQNVYSDGFRLHSEKNKNISVVSQNFCFHEGIPLLPYL